MIKPLWHFLDWLAIQFASARMPDATGMEPHLEEAARLVNGPAFLSADLPAPAVKFVADRVFTFASPLPSPYEENNIVFGRIYSEGADWRKKPAVILVHGWNDKPNHYYRFPALARKIAQAGMTAVTIELPYHFQRRPRQRLGAASNFLSADILRTAQAAAQAVSEIRGLTRWLAQEGCAKIGLVGVSMGAWLGGLAACHETRLDALILITPVARLDRLIDEVAFCRSIKTALRGQKLHLGRLDLRASPPLMARENVLLIKAQFDLFAPAETVDELALRWGGPEMWTLRMGHISAVGAPGLTRRLVAWLEEKLGGRAATRTDSCQDSSAAAGAPPSPGPRASS